LALIVFMIAMAVKVFDNMSEEAEHELSEMAKTINRLIESDQGEDLPQAVVATVSAEDAELQIIEVLDPEGRVIVNQAGWPEPTKRRSRKLGDGLQGSFSHLWRDGRPWLLFDGWAVSGTEIHMAIELSEIQAEVLRITQDFLWALPFALAVVGLAAWWISRKATRPVLELTRVAERIGDGELSRRISEPDRLDEIGNLSRVFNRMMDRLELSHQQAVRFSSDASHELRTPLTVLQGKIEAALQKGVDEDGGSVPAEVVGELSEQTQRLKSIVESLLFLARADAGKLDLTRSPIDVRILLAELQEDVMDLEPDQSIEVDFDSAPPAGAEIAGDGRLIRLALFNLLRNAVKYNEEADGKCFVKLTVDSEANGAAVVFRVLNSGPAIGGDDSERIFDRFARISSKTKKRGTGLGLSLARTVAELHGGSLKLESSAAGVNTFALVLPGANVALDPNASSSEGSESDGQAE
jgi:signal transduction histidine kinase